MTREQRVILADFCLYGVKEGDELFWYIRHGKFNYRLTKDNPFWLKDSDGEIGPATDRISKKLDHKLLRNAGRRLGQSLLNYSKILSVYTDCIEVSALEGLEP